MIRGACLAMLLAAGFAAHAQEARYLQSVTWPQPSGQGGYSGIEVSADGQSFVAVSDNGNLLEGRLARTNGTLTGVADLRIGPLRAADGRQLGKLLRDAEGLARDADGQLYVAFERHPRLRAYGPGRTVRDVTLPAGIADLPRNRQIEALAIAPDGTLLAFAESPRAGTNGFWLWLYDGSGWRVGPPVPRRGNLVPVGADFGPDGRLYLLERVFRGIGFRSRVRRFAFQNGAFSAEEVLFETPLGLHDNLEGLSVWQAPDGDLRLTMISDDNFSPLQRTEIVEYRVPQALAEPADSG